MVHILLQSEQVPTNSEEDREGVRIRFFVAGWQFKNFFSSPLVIDFINQAEHAQEAESTIKTKGLHRGPQSTPPIARNHYG